MPDRRKYAQRSWQRYIVVKIRRIAVHRIGIDHRDVAGVTLRNVDLEI